MTTQTLTRKELPKSISNEMKKWRVGLIPFPESYILFHKELAEKALEKLRFEKNLKVWGTEVIDDGWLDGMKTLHVVAEEPKGKLIKLSWHDGNQEFFIHSKTGGSFPYRLD